MTGIEQLRSRSRRQRVCEQDIRRWSRVLREQPSNAVAYYCRGNAFRLKGQEIAALCDYNTAIRLRPDFAAAHFYKASTCAMLGYRLEEARAYRSFLACSDRCNRELLLRVMRRLEALEASRRVVGQ